ncbi:MAG: hypothetical protein ACTSP3_03330 [Candidatus Heimdallarchaeaceae archaeon]
MCNNRFRYGRVSHDAIDYPVVLTTEEIIDIIKSAIELNFGYITLPGGDSSIRENIYFTSLPIQIFSLSSR